MIMLPKAIYRLNSIPIKLPMVFFVELGQIISQFVQNNSNSQNSLERKEWNWRNQPAWLQTILQSYTHWDSMVQAQSQKYRSMEQNRKLRDKSMHLWTPFGFSYLGCGVSLHCCSSKVQPMLLTLDEEYLLTTALPDLQRGIAPLGPPVPAQPRRGVGPPGHCPWPWTRVTPLIATPGLGRGVAPLFFL